MFQTGSNKANRFTTAVIALLVLLALSVSMAGAFSEADCDDECSDEAGTCCECVCCPTKVVMNVFDEVSDIPEFANQLCTVEKISDSGDRVWFGTIDHPPQNLA